MLPQGIHTNQLFLRNDTNEVKKNRVSNISHSCFSCSVPSFQHFFASGGSLPAAQWIPNDLLQEASGLSFVAWIKVGFCLCNKWGATVHS